METYATKTSESDDIYEPAAFSGDSFLFPVSIYSLNLSPPVQ